jgi:hypothetical protein
VPDPLLLGISSPYAQSGKLWDSYRRHFGQEGDPVLVWQAPPLAMNPAVPEAFVRKAYEDDPVAAAAEFGAEFRRDVEVFVTREAVVVAGAGCFARCPAGATSPSSIPAEAPRTR